MFISIVKMLQNLFFGNGQSRIQIWEPFAYGLGFLEQTILAQWQVQFNGVEANNVKVHFEAF